HGRLQERPVRLVRAKHAGGDGGFEIAHAATPSAFEAVWDSTLLSWDGVSSECLPRMRAQMPAMCGVAKLLPVQRSVPPPSHATSRSRPRPKNSTGGEGL